MTDASQTTTLALPLLAAGQAQKHVTANEALIRLDLFAAPARSRALAAPPVAPAEGSVYLIPEGGQGAWGAPAGRIAAYLDGGWRFLVPPAGQRAWVVDEGRAATFDGARWVAADGATAHGAATATGLAVIDLAVTDGAAEAVAPAAIGDKWIVYGITGRVLQGLGGGGAVSMRLGVPGATDRYGSGYGISAGSLMHGITGRPQAYYGPTDLTLTAEGGRFGAGLARLCVHYVALTPPQG
jgi:hypothetical protein